VWGAKRKNREPREANASKEKVKALFAGKTRNYLLYGTVNVTFFYLREKLENPLETI
jgi:hypothetical protein